MPRLGRSDGVPLVLNQHFHRTMDDPDPEFAGRLATADAVEFRRAQPPVGSLRAQTRG
jgi:hypothetical protein